MSPLRSLLLAVCLFVSLAGVSASYCNTYYYDCRSCTGDAGCVWCESSSYCYSASSYSCFGHLDWVPSDCSRTSTAGAIAGAVIGSIAFIACVVTAIYCFRRRRYYYAQQQGVVVMQPSAGVVVGQPGVVVQQPGMVVQQSPVVYGTASPMYAQPQYAPQPSYAQQQQYAPQYAQPQYGAPAQYQQPPTYPGNPQQFQSPAPQ